MTDQIKFHPLARAFWEKMIENDELRERALARLRDVPALLKEKSDDRDGTT